MIRDESGGDDSSMLKKIEIDLQYQPLIDAPPPQVGDLYQNACRSDGATITSWKEIWLRNYQASVDRFGAFKNRSIGQLYGINRHKGAIVIGSGPSLKESLDALRENQSLEHPLLTISCLHNLGYFEDEGIYPDYYLSLDSGKIVVGDVSEGRKNSDYWAKTKGKKLLAFVASDPELFAKWQGDIYLFNCLIPDYEIKTKFDEMQKFSHYVSCGGNALGGCMYVAKAIMGSQSIHYVGADFCFSYENQFHSYATHYDAPGQYVMAYDVYGMPRKTWPSYMGFKFWFDHIAMTVPGRWVNCSFGTLGAYREGNLKAFEYMPLSDALVQYRMSEIITLERRGDLKEVLSKEKIKLKDIFTNPEYPQDIILF